MGTLELLTCLLRNLYAAQEATVKTRHGNNQLVPNRERSMSRLYMSPCLFNLYAEYIMRITGMDEAQAGIRTAGRNINNLRYADDMTLIVKSEEELKHLLTKVNKESEKAQH